eukprot:4374866-Amphidinium_carterae.1
MGVKPTHSRPITQEEFIQLCIVFLSMIDPASYVTIEPVDRKVTAKAKEFRSQHYATIKQIIEDDVQNKGDQVGLGSVGRASGSSELSKDLKSHLNRCCWSLGRPASQHSSKG